MKKINLIAAALVAVMFIGCGETKTETETVYVDHNVTVEVPVEKIVEVEVPVDVYVYQDYTSTVKFQDLKVDINCEDGNCTASILEYNCYPSEFSGGPACNCGYYPIKEYKSDIQCVECCNVCTTSSSSSSEDSCSSEASSSSSSESCPED